MTSPFLLPDTMLGPPPMPPPKPPPPMPPKPPAPRMIVSPALQQRCVKRQVTLQSTQQNTFILFSRDGVGDDEHDGQEEEGGEHGFAHDCGSKEAELRTC